MTTKTFRIFFDMDGVLVDFDRYCRDERMTPGEVKRGVGAYLKMQPIDGALAGIRKVMSIAGQYGGEVWLATKPPTGIPWAYADKVEWVLEHLPELKRRIILTHDKGLLGGPEDYLIDDRPFKANCMNFRGTLVVFGDAPHPTGRDDLRVRDWAELPAWLHGAMARAAAGDAPCHACGLGRKCASPECPNPPTDPEEPWPTVEEVNAARGLLRLGPLTGTIGHVVPPGGLGPFTAEPASGLGTISASIPLPSVGRFGGGRFSPGPDAQWLDPAIIANAIDPTLPANTVRLTLNSSGAGVLVNTETGAVKADPGPGHQPV